MSDIEDRLNYLENKNKVNFFNVEKRLTNLESTSSQEAFDKLNDRIQELEDLLLLLQLESTKIKEKISGGTGLELLKATNVEERLSRLEEHPPSGTIVKELPEEVQNRLDEIEEKLSSLGEVKVPTDIDSRFSEMEERISALKDRRSPDLEMRLNRLEEEMGKKTTVIEEVPESLEKKLRELEEDLHSLKQEDHIKELKREFEEDLDKIEKRISHVKGQTIIKEVPEDIKEKLNEIEEKLSSKEEIPSNVVNRLNELEQKLSSRAEVSTEIPNNIENRLSELEQKITFLRGAKEAVTIPEDIKNELQSLKTRIKQMQVAPAGSGVDETLRQKLNDIDSMNQNLDNKISMLENKMKNLPNITPELKKGMPADFSNIDRRLEYVEKEIKDTIPLKKVIEDEAAQRISVEKRLQEINDSISTIDKSLSEIKPSNYHEVEKLKTTVENQKITLEDLNKNLEMKSINFLTKQLEEFANLLDKKLTGLKTDLNQRIKVIEAPDMHPLEKRVEFLEQKVSEMIFMMKNVSSRIPVVVE